MYFFDGKDGELKEKTKHFFLNILFQASMCVLVHKMRQMIYFMVNTVFKKRKSSQYFVKSYFLNRL